MASRTWNHIAICCAFAGTTEEGGVRIEDKPVDASGSVIARLWPWRRAWQKAVGRKMLFH